MSTIITGTSQVKGNFDGEAATGNATTWYGWLDMASERFNPGVADLRAKLDAALTALAGDSTTQGDPGNPAKLARYQSALSEYNLYRSAQASTVKALADGLKENVRKLD
jgi:type III secretion protein F